MLIRSISGYRRVKFGTRSETHLAALLSSQNIGYISVIDVATFSPEHGRSVVEELIGFHSVYKDDSVSHTINDTDDFELGDLVTSVRFHIYDSFKDDACSENYFPFRNTGLERFKAVAVCSEVSQIGDSECASPYELNLLQPRLPRLKLYGLFDDLPEETVEEIIALLEGDYARALMDKTSATYQTSQSVLDVFLEVVTSDSGPRIGQFEEEHSKALDTL